MAKLKFEAPTILQLSTSTQLRVVAAEYEGLTKLDARVWYKTGDSKEYKPTQKGINVPLNHVDAFIAAITKHAKELPRRVVDVEDDTRWVIGVNADDMRFKKDHKHVYLTEEEARSKTPPDGYRLFEVQIKKGVITVDKKLAFRKDGEWKNVKATPAPAKKTVKAKTTRR